MYTRCPACLTQFRLHAAQIAAAAGRVRCGVCGEAFDALGRLADTPQPAPAEPSQSIDPAVRPVAIDTAAGLSLPIEPLAADTVPDWPEEDAEPRSRHPGRWLTLAVVLVLLGLAQAAWFHRDALYERFPQLLPWAEKLCQRLDCQVYRQREVSAFEILNRDVRAHPDYKNALQVNATIVNRADHRQPYPRIQLALYDLHGNVLAYREFAPAIYLDASLPVSQGMPPNMPLHIMFELSDETTDAVSFEFGFL